MCPRHAFRSTPSSGPPARTRSCDALIVGGGHNGLVCAGYLAAAGLHVIVLERRNVVGGAAVTEEFHPGFRNSTAAYAVSLLHPRVIRDLDLHGHGLRIVEREMSNFLPTADGRYLAVGPGRTHAEVAKFSKRDAACLDAWALRLGAIADLLRGLVLQTPPNVVQGNWRRALPELLRAARHTAGIILAPTLAYMERAWSDARMHGWSRHPVIEMLIPSTLDDSLAQPGAHVASLFCQHVAPVLPDGASWDDHREAVADLMIDTVNRYAPNFRASVLGRQIYSPLDLERTLGLVGGDIFHGVMSLDQMFSARPMLGHGNYRGPVPGLYMCGAGTHPGGGVTGAPGHNAAREVLADLRRRKFGR